MAINERIRNILPEGSLVFDSYAYDNSIIGTTDSGNVVYDYDLMVKELSEDKKCSILEAMEWIDYNTVRSVGYFPDPRPIIIHKLEEEIDEY